MAFQLVFLWALIGVGVNVSGASAFTAAVVFLLCVVGAILTFAPIGSMPEARAAELAILQHARGEKVRLGGAVRPQKASSPAKPADRFFHFR